MTQRTRERIALVVFLLLACGSILSGLWYLAVGHQWNTTANTIDDAAGSLDHYTVFLYEGVATPSEREASREPRTMHSAVEEYLGKNASVYVVRITDPDFYEDGTVVSVGSDRVGILSVFTRAQSGSYQNVVARLKDQEEVDYVLCITPDVQLLQGSRGVRGIDILLTCAETSSNVDVRIGVAYRVESPARGCIGAILVSPKGVVSSRVLTG